MAAVGGAPLHRPPPAAHDARRSLIVLFLSAILLLSAGMHRISLQSLDDAFYARKGVEMARSGNFFTVTLGDEPAFQNPPLQFWIMGRSFVVFGENDFAARFPFVVMGLVTLVAAVRIGTLTVGRTAGVTAAALLLITPLFSSTARGTMMEIPFGCWVTLTFLLFLEGVNRTGGVEASGSRGSSAASVSGAAHRTRWHLLMALPIAAAILTKSVLGVVPLMVLPVVLALSRDLRRRCGHATWIGVLLGVLLGFSWPVHQWFLFGDVALRQHFLGQVLEPSTQDVGVTSRLLGYPLILLRSYQPILFPGLAGAVLLAREWLRRRRGSGVSGISGVTGGSGDSGREDWRGLLLVTWIVVPVAIASFSSAQSSRYIFSILTPLALCGAWWLLRVAPRVAAFITRWFTPALATAAAIAFWVQPTLLTRDQNQIFKSQAPRLKRDIPVGATVGYLGTRYWLIANPLLYYTDRPLTQLTSAAELCDASRNIAVVFVDQDQADAVHRQTCGLTPSTMIEGADWMLLKLK
jgi:4-amino-4-deoxy-L-arabinose transferase-like glycosyltransferase